MAVNQTSTLNLKITAQDQASKIFLDFAKNIGEAFKLATAGSESLDGVFAAFGRGASEGAKSVQDSGKSMRDTIYMTREELLGWAREFPELFQDPNAAMNNFADISTRDLARVIGAATNTSISIRDNLTAIADLTDGPAIKSINKLRETWVTTGDEVVARAKEIVDADESMAKWKSLVDMPKYAKAVVEGYDNIKIAMINTTGEEEEVDRITQTFSNNLQKLMATNVLSVQQLEKEFDRLTEIQGLEHLAGMKGDQNAMLGVLKQVNPGQDFYVPEEEKPLDTMAKLASGQMAFTAMENTGAKVTGLFSGATKSAMTFQQQVDATAAVLEQKIGKGVSLTQDQYKKLNDTILKTGESGMYSAEELAETTNTLAKQGVGYEELTNGILGSVQNLAAATDSDLESTANVVTDVWHEMGQELPKEFGTNMKDQFDGIANYISGATHNARLSMQEFLGTMKYAGPLAGEMGVSMKDLSTTIALLAQHNIKNYQAGTTLRTLFSTLVPATDAAKKKFEEWGLIQSNGLTVFEKSKGQFKDLNDIISILHDKFGNLSEVQQRQALVSVFGKYALSGMTILANESADSWQELTDQVTQNANAQELANKKWDNSAGQARRLKASWETFKKEIGEQLLPVLNQLLDEGLKLIHGFESMPDWLKTTTIYLGLFGGGLMLTLGKLGNAVTGFLFLKNALGDVGTAFFGIGGKIAPAAEAIGEVGTAAEIATGAEGAGGVLGLADAALGLLGPIGLIAGAVGAVGLAAYAASPSIRNWVSDMTVPDATINKIKRIGNEAIDGVVQSTDKAIGQLAYFKATGTQMTDDMYNDIKSTAQNIYSQIIAASDHRKQQETADLEWLEKNAPYMTAQQIAGMKQAIDQQAPSVNKSTQDLIKKINDDLDQIKSGKASKQLMDDLQNSLVQLQKLAVTQLSDTKNQQDTILDMLKADANSAGKITNDQAQQALGQLHATFEDGKKKADDTYQESVSKYEEMYNDGIIKSQAELQNYIDKAKDVHDQTLDKLQDMHDKGVAKIGALMTDGGASIDANKDKIMSPLEKLGKWAVGIWDEIFHPPDVAERQTEQAFEALQNGSLQPPENATLTQGHSSWWSSLFGHNADGTDNWRGGWTWVGEEGPELMKLPKGTQIKPHDESVKMMTDGLRIGGRVAGGHVFNININVNGAGKDGKQIGQDIAQQIRLQMPTVTAL